MPERIFQGYLNPCEAGTAVIRPNLPLISSRTCMTRASRSRSPGSSNRVRGRGARSRDQLEVIAGHGPQHDPAPSRVLRPLCLEAVCSKEGSQPAGAQMLNGRVFALDLDGALVESARAEVERQGGSVPEWIAADARDADRRLPQPVDYVLMTNTFHGVPEHADFVAVLARCLKPGGRMPRSAKPPPRSKLRPTVDCWRSRWKRRRSMPLRRRANERCSASRM